MSVRLTKVRRELMDQLDSIILHQKEDGSLQLRDSLHFLWCACGKPAVHCFPDEEDHWRFQCILCAKE